MKYVVTLFSCGLLLQSGCGGAPTSASGGTPGSLIAGETLVPDFEIKIYEAGNATPLGLGTTGNDGTFQLVRPRGEGPLWLLPGEYTFTLESLGPATPRISPAYANVSKTPLKVNWKVEDKSLDLKIPALK